MALSDVRQIYYIEVLNRKSRAFVWSKLRKEYRDRKSAIKRVDRLAAKSRGGLPTEFRLVQKVGEKETIIAQRLFCKITKS